MHNRREEWNAEVLPSLRLWVSSTRLRVADLCLLSLDAPREQIPTHPPILVIEVLDEQDRFCSMLEKLNDYLRFGVECVWLVDPGTRRVWRARDSGLHRVDGDELVVPETVIRIPVSEAFAELDRV
jgi:Uma2 family endonuclease